MEVWRLLGTDSSQGTPLPEGSTGHGPPWPSQLVCYANYTEQDCGFKEGKDKDDKWVGRGKGESP